MNDRVPFEEVWEEVPEKLELFPELEAKTLFEVLQREYPGRFSDGQLRTLQRYIKQWRALEGPGNISHRSIILGSLKPQTSHEWGDLG